MVLALLVCAFLIAMAVWLVASTLYQHPENKPLWVTLGFAIVTTSLAVAARGASLVANVVAVGALTALLLTAALVKTYYDPLVQRPMTKEVFVGDILERPWFTA
jgi:hypothetical protein